MLAWLGARAGGVGELRDAKANTDRDAMPVSTATTVVAASTVSEDAAPKAITVKLKKARRSRVRWADDVVDNEELCRKKSKCCCVYHRPRELDESSDEEEHILSLLSGPACCEPDGAGPSSQG